MIIVPYKVVPIVVGEIEIDNKILLGKRRRRPGKLCAGYWDLPGGKIKPKEDFFPALKREFKEETDLEIRKASLKEVYHYYHKKEKEAIIILYKIEDFLGSPRAGSDLERVRLFSREEMKISEEGLTPWARYFLREYLE